MTLDPSTWHLSVARRLRFAALPACIQARHRLPELPVAVRSSAIDEDSATTSVAGMHETYLNVVGTEAIPEAIGRCWESARSHRALEYRRQQGLSLENVQFAVLVQQLIVSDVSIVAFSMNPVTLNRDNVMINASWGLGESLVSGTVTPDTLVVRKYDLEVTSQTIADKGRMTVAVPGGTREVDVPHFLRSEACLSDEQLIEVAQLALSLEATMGYPVDFECAYAGGKLYLLQCRPITTLG